MDNVKCPYPWNLIQRFEPKSFQRDSNGIPTEFQRDSNAQVPGRHGAVFAARWRGSAGAAGLPRRGSAVKHSTAARIRDVGEGAGAAFRKIFR